MVVFMFLSIILSGFLLIPESTGLPSPSLEPRQCCSTGDPVRPYVYYMVNGVPATYGGGTHTNPNYNMYTISLNGNSDVILGKGWNPGGSRTAHYSGNFNFNGNSSLTLYGWTRNPIIEYWVIESYGLYNPSSAAQKKGSVYCDGANYDILQATRINATSIDGPQTFQQFWSVRNPKKEPGNGISGSVTTSCHFSAWANAGMRLGSSHNFQVVAVESHFDAGSAQITFS